MVILKQMLEGKRGQEAAQIITACIGIWIEKPAIMSVKNEFESIKYSAFNEAMKKSSTFAEEKLEEIRDYIRSRIIEMTSNSQ